MTDHDHASADLLFDHIGIVVPSLEEGRQTLSSLFGHLHWTTRFDDPQLGVSVVFAQDLSGIVYELITPFGFDSPVLRTLTSRANLLNQIAYRTRSLDASVARLRKARAVPVGRSAPAVAFGGARVQFLMTPLGFLMELIEVDHVVHEFA
jgi:methylmalonyl-CoA/ethylmalonyl-CoA epimerase